MKRKIIKIDEEKCTGCGVCIPDCPEGALQLIDGKARLISDLFCDGLGACIKACPTGAMVTEEREAEPYDEYKVMDNVVKGGVNVIKAHLSHLKDHGQDEFFNLNPDPRRLVFGENQFGDVNCKCFDQFPASSVSQREEPAGNRVIINRLCQVIRGGGL